MNLQYIVDKNGGKRSVIIKHSDFKKIQSRIVELEDALDLDRAERTAVSFKEYSEIRKDLKKQVKL